MSGTVAAALAKAALTALSDPQGRKVLGYVLCALLAPFILLIAVLCAIASGGAEQNRATVRACFAGEAVPQSAPADFRRHIRQMQEAFSSLDSAVEAVNAQAEGDSVDPHWVKAVFFVLFFGEQVPGRQAANRFVDCFHKAVEKSRTVEVAQADGTVATRRERYTVTVPLPPEGACAALKGLLGRDITEEEKSNAQEVYTLAAQLRQ